MNLSKEQIEKKVNKLMSEYGEIIIKEILAGGVVSDVYSAMLIDKTTKKQTNIVVKYTKLNIEKSKIFSKKDIEESFFNAQATQNLDILIQNILSSNTPKIIKHFPESSITVMYNFTDEKFKLLQTRLLEKDISINSAKKLGETLAILRKDLQQNVNIQIESSQSQFNERFLELKVLLYNGRMDFYNQIEEDFLQENKYITWTDGDPKNFAIDNEGESMVFDLGRAIKCDPDFMLANLLGHLGLFVIAGYLENNSIFLEKVIEGFLEKYKEFDKLYEIDEKKFVNYFTASLLHRGMAMRWIDPRIANIIGEDSLKYACIHFGDMVFDKNNSITTIKKLFLLLQEIQD
ncbi:MAG: hypothetical protein PHE25_02420 [Candidatus Gracilibacteria bacterium]|nr:hypothetical protein [Candidatus Gracilibacteria bacterium]